MALTEKQLLLLDNFMYLKASVLENKNITTLGKLVEYLEEHPEEVSSDNLSGGFDVVNDEVNGVENFNEILKEIKADPELCALGLGEVTDMDTDNFVRGRQFLQYDEEGNVIGNTVAFRGTGGYWDAWIDDFQGAYMKETPAQGMAKEFIEGLETYGVPIDVTGHSKGGNLAMYVTMVCGDRIGSCFSVDGQGFGEDAINSLTPEQLEEASGKIKSVSAYNDYVNIILKKFAGTNLYYPNEATGTNAHSSYYLYETNKEQLDANNGMFTEAFAVEQDNAMVLLQEAMNLVLKNASEDNIELIADVGGSLVAQAIGKKDADIWRTLGNIGENVKEYELEQGHIWKDPLNNMIEYAEARRTGGRSIINGVCEFYVDNKESLAVMTETAGEIAIEMAVEGITKKVNETKETMEKVKETVSEAAMETGKFVISNPSILLNPMSTLTLTNAAKWIVQMNENGEYEASEQNACSKETTAVPAKEIAEMER